MILRIAQLSDIPSCGALDASYTTEISWQIAEERALRTSSSQILLGLRTIQLPRPRSVVPADPAVDLETEWDGIDLFLVAEDDHVSRIIGYLCATAQAKNAWISRLVVDKPYRRAGVATGMLAATREWARQNDLQSVLAAPPTKNYPAISLFRERGYRICGFNERHFANGDIALYLAHDIRNE